MTKPKAKTCQDFKVSPDMFGGRLFYHPLWVYCSSGKNVNKICFEEHQFCLRFIQKMQYTFYVNPVIDDAYVFSLNMDIVPELVENMDNLPELVENMDIVPELIENMNNAPQLVENMDTVPELVENMDNVPELVENMDNVPE